MRLADDRAVHHLVVSTAACQPSRSLPLKIGVNPSPPLDARILSASSLPISRTKRLRQRISLPWVWS